MDKFTHLSDFLGYLFDDSGAIEKARAITEGILKAVYYPHLGKSPYMAVSKHLSPKKCGVVSTPTPLKTDLWVIDSSTQTADEPFANPIRTRRSIVCLAFLDT